ncbi:MAG: sugar phosphate isomerase/epimerase family protein [Anaerolineales bacterium]
MYKIGIMQGRLSAPTDNRIQFFPKDEWMMEFSKAAQIGFDYIEWLYDLHDADTNPIATDEGIKNARSLSAQYGIRIKSLCAHCFIETPLAGANDQKLNDLLKLLDWLFHRAKQLGLSRVVLPLEDATLLSNKVEFERQVAWVKKALKIAESTNIEIDLETTLEPSRFSSFLQQVPHSLLKVNYDIGNSAGMGYKIEEEFTAYGSRIGSIHIKDKILKGPTVAIGTGQADFPALARLLRQISFDGDIVLEAARGARGAEMSWAKRNLNFTIQQLRSFKNEEPL